MYICMYVMCIGAASVQRSKGIASNKTMRVISKLDLLLGSMHLSSAFVLYICLPHHFKKQA